MFSIVELRGKSDTELEKMLENAREEMFNLRFQKASARLEEYSRLREVRREIAQMETVLDQRQKAATVAQTEPKIADVLRGKAWTAAVEYNYEDLVWYVTFFDEDDDELASAQVNLNKKRPQGRAARRTKKQPLLVTQYEISG